MYNSSTDAYQDASNIMAHEYANKYADYWTKKTKTIKSGKANFKDSGRQKTYNAEFRALRAYKDKYPNDARFKFLDWKGSQKLFKKIAKSATYKKLCENEVGSTKKSTNSFANSLVLRLSSEGGETMCNGCIPTTPINVCIVL